MLQTSYPASDAARLEDMGAAVEVLRSIEFLYTRVLEQVLSRSLTECSLYCTVVVYSTHSEW